jgi:hypothetical protein
VAAPAGAASWHDAVGDYGAQGRVSRQVWVCVLCCLQVSARLPPPVQVLNATLAHSRRGERDGVLRQALAGGAGDVPGTSLDALGAAAHQLIDDMEDQQVRGGGVTLQRLVQKAPDERGVLTLLCVWHSRGAFLVVSITQERPGSTVH